MGVSHVVFASNSACQQMCVTYVLFVFQNFYYYYFFFYISVFSQGRVHLNDAWRAGSGHHTEI